MKEISSVAEYLEIITEIHQLTHYDVLFAMKNNINEVKNQNLATYLEALHKDIKNSLDLSKKPYKFYYRGQYNVEYDLIPSALRKGLEDKEDYFYHEMLVQCSNDFKRTTHLEKLVTMQHYDCPTRLLDITSNPLVALYFACKNFGCENCGKKEEGKVFVFPVNEEEVSYFDSDKALMLSCLPKFTLKDKMQLCNKTYKDIFKKKFPHIKGQDKYIRILERFHHEISTEIPSFKREIQPLDLLKPLFVQPNKTNNRIVKQDGAFILSGLSNSYDEALAKLENMVYKTIIIKDKEKILKELEYLGIHEASLFPEIDKVAHYLKTKDTNLS